MNLMTANFLAGARRWLVAGLLALVLGSRASAQSEQPERWLFIFDTSFAMKKKLPAVEAELKEVMASAVSGQVQAGDSVGVWTFNRELHAGQFPLVTWDPARAAVLASNLVTFLHKQSYSGETTWSALQPLLGQVIQNSARLTIVIFCDGQGAVNWTPYNDGINQTFSQTLAERKKTNQPFVLLVRTQHGQFTGCTVNFPPGALNVPPFPPLPEPVKIVPTNPPPVVPVVVKPPPVIVPSLFIVGTNVGTNLNDLPKVIPAPVTNPVVTTSPPPNPAPGSNPPTPAVLTNPPPSAPDLKTAEVKNIPPSINPVASVAPAKAVPTNVAPATVTNEPDHASQALIYVGAGVSGAVVALVLFFWVRAMRRPRGSLISSTMQNDPRLPPRK